jgi:replicative DNA helicase
MSDPREDFDEIPVEILPLAEAAEREAQDTSATMESGFADLDDCMDGGFREGDFTIVSGVPGDGKCLGKGTPVLMYDGSIRAVETICVGEQLMGPDSKPRNVLALGTGIDELYEIQQTKGDNYTVNGNHILVLRKTGRKIEKEITVNDAIQNGLSVRWKGFAVPVEYSAKKVEIDPYFLGVWLGDGNTKDVRITSADDEIEQYLRGYATKLGLQFTKTPQPSRAYSMVISKGNKNSGYSLQGHLRSIGVLGNKHIPTDYIINSREVRLQLLAGLIDTDGYTNHEGYEFVNKNEGMARDFQRIARSLGFRASLKRFLNKDYQRYYYKVGVSGDCSVIPVKIARKKVKVRSQIKNVLNTGITINSVGRGRYYGFQIDGDGRFLLGDCTVTHNTTLCRMFTLNFAARGIPSLWFSHEMSTRELWDSFKKMGADTSLISFVPDILQEDMTWMFARIEQAIAERNIKVVFIDTLGDIVKSVSRQQELGNYATYLSQLCKDLRKFAIAHKIMIVAVAHATKQTRSNSNETGNSDIANSNGIPAAATNIFHVWRDNEEDNLSYVKIGKSRRDGSAKNHKFKFRFTGNKLLPEGRHEDVQGDTLWRETK